MMNIHDIIAKKRDAMTLSDEEIRFFIDGFTSGTIADYQASALLMAIYLNGMDEHETAALTLAMADSGDRMDLSRINGITVDKHSSGGVGDKTTLIIAPIIAACGLTMVKMSGRGLGHTGGTLDKLESIPGFSVSISPEAAIEQARKIGLVIAGQTASLAPADKGLYALRDATETVGSIPLIASSIMSKKIASGADVLLLDVKVGDGAYMKTLDDARKLAVLMKASGEKCGIKTSVLLSDMNTPLGLCIGNSLEVAEAVSLLKTGRGDRELLRVCVAICTRLLLDAGIATTSEKAEAMVTEALKNGKALEKFRQLIKAQGGDDRFTDDLSLLPVSPTKATVPSPTSGYVSRIHCEEMGRISCFLGAGRIKKEDDIDHGAGIVLCKKTGDYVEAGEPLAEAYTGDVLKIQEAVRRISAAYEFSDAKPEYNDVVYDII